MIAQTIMNLHHDNTNISKFNYKIILFEIVKKKIPPNKFARGK